jgi:hypothetical protein
MRKLFYFITFISLVCATDAQNVGIGTTTPNASALLHLNSTNKGVLIPQVSLSNLTDVVSIPSPASGLLVYNTTQPGVNNDLVRGYYYYSVSSLTWVRLADNLNDNVWQNGGLLGIQLRDKTDGVEMLDDFTGSATNFSPKVKILNMVDSASLNAKNNITVMVLSGINRKPLASLFEFRQKSTIIFENGYFNSSNSASATNNSTAISAYTEDADGVAGTQTNGLAFYTFAAPQNNAVSDTPSVAMFRHNVGIGAYPTDINNVTEGRLQITGFSNGDQLSLRHPSSINLKWGLYVSAIDSSLNFYSNGSLRANIDRVTGVYSALSDRNFKKNIQLLSPVLETIKKLPVYSYNYTDSKDGERRMIGLMAQDVQPYFPELVYQRYDREITKPVLTMDYTGFGVLAIKAVQEQQKIIDGLKVQVEQLVNRVKEMENKN